MQIITSTTGIQITICYAESNEITLLNVDVGQGKSIADILSEPSILVKFPILEKEDCKVGIFGKLKLPETILQDQDRLEIYRPLIFDPMEARRRRAGKRKSGKM
jgi:hypothetical protein